VDLPANSLRRALAILCAIALTAGAYFVSSGLHRLWWPAWIAPLPVLLLAPRVRAGQAFAIALAARALAAAFDFWQYMRQTFDYPIWLALVTVLIPGAFFAFAVVFHRGLLRKVNPWLAMLAFPVTMVAAENLSGVVQGAFLGAGYTQLGNLPILQLAAITGVLGISFSVNLFPAGLAALASARAKPRLRMAAALGAFYACALCYGLLRLHTTPQTSTSVVVGLVETHAGNDMFPHDAARTMTLLHGYAAQVKSLAAEGAQFVILPEKIALIPDSESANIDEFFQQTARDAHVQVLLGIQHTTAQGAYNEARLYSATGQIENVYRKHHLVPGWEDQLTPGTEISVLPQPEGRVGIQICYDMDFPEWSRRYARQQVGLMLVPAWDQGVNLDGAWHGHMSVMRGVEGGFTVVRDAKNGLLTASDDRGRILAEEPTRSDGAFITMLATVPVRHDSTLYQEWGDWFAWADLVALAALLVFWLTAWKFQPQS
jgi:apolipoprotein N-acyltransferase